MNCCYCQRESSYADVDIPVYDNSATLDSMDFGYTPDTHRVICRECMREHIGNGRRYIICHKCGKIIRNNDSLEYVLEDGTVTYICYDCTDGLRTCPECGRLFDNGTQVRTNYSEEPVDICSDCAQTYYESCDECGTMVYCDSMYTEPDGALVCPTCHQNLITEHRTLEHARNVHPSDTMPIAGYHYHHDYDPVFCSLPDEDTRRVPFLGVELEVDTRSSVHHEDANNTARNVIEAMPRNFIFFEHDGSLSGGFENITQPATLAYHESLKDNYIAMFRAIRTAGFRSHQTKTCGFHIHVNRDFFPASDDEACVARMLYIVEKFYDELIVFSRRTKSSLSRWVNKSSKTPEQQAKDWKEGLRDDRYRPVNLCNRNTFEFRIFRGTLKYNTFIATLNLVYNIVMTARFKTTTDIQNMEFEDLLTTKRMKRYWDEAKERVERRNNRNNQNEANEPEVVSGDVVENDDINQTDDINPFE